ncbi:hypothetical protein D3C87_1514290 [compost metagenome]
MDTEKRSMVDGACDGENSVPGASSIPRSAASRASTSLSRPQSAQTNIPALGSWGTVRPSFSKPFRQRWRASSTLARTRSMWRRYCPSISTRWITRSPSSGEVRPASIFKSANF